MTILGNTRKCVGRIQLTVSGCATTEKQTCYDNCCVWPRTSCSLAEGAANSDPDDDPLLMENSMSSLSSDVDGAGLAGSRGAFLGGLLALWEVTTVLRIPSMVDQINRAAQPTSTQQSARLLPILFCGSPQ
jgi:hypothetical protein